MQQAELGFQRGELKVSKSKERRPRYNLEPLLEKLKGQAAETLRCLYEEHSERMRHSGSHIWIIGSVFIPLSLSGIVLDLTNSYRAISVACFSIFLIWTWYLISARIRDALDRDLAVCAAIETILLDLEARSAENGLAGLVIALRKRRAPHLYRIRLAIPLAITMGWLIVAGLSFVM